MKNRSIVLLATAIVACEQQSVSSINVSTDEFTGAWYGTYANGRETSLFDAMLYADGRIDIRHYRCLSSTQVSMTQQTGSWHVDQDKMTMTLDGTNDPDNASSPFVSTYRITYHSPDYTRYTGMETGARFWKERKWTDQPYTCATTAADIREHRQAALDDGRADESNPLNEANR